MCKLVDAYYRLLNVLIVATVVILLVPVALQILWGFLPSCRATSGPRRWRASSSSGW